MIDPVLMEKNMEKKFCAIDLSGTRNIKFCVSKLAKLLDEMPRSLRSKAMLLSLLYT